MVIEKKKSYRYHLDPCSDFFKEEAKKHHTQYQKMIRNLLDLYVAKQAHP